MIVPALFNDPAAAKLMALPPSPAPPLVEGTATVFAAPAPPVTVAFAFTCSAAVLFTVTATVPFDPFDALLTAGWS